MPYKRLQGTPFGVPRNSSFSDNRKLFGRIFFFLHLCKALAAIYRAIVTRDERHLSHSSAGCANSLVHLSRSSRCVFTLVSASLAALRFVYKALGLVKLLLACSEYELLAAILAN